MTSRAALRPYLPTDAQTLIGIFRASIRELTSDDYSEAQQNAWMMEANDEDAFAKRLASALTLIATIDGEPAAFATLIGGDKLHFLFVHPAHAGQGLAAMLVDALEKLAANRGAVKLATEASDSALAFFQKRGFTMKQRNSVHRNGEWLANTTMEKELLAPDMKARR